MLFFNRRRKRFSGDFDVPFRKHKKFGIVIFILIIIGIIYAISISRKLGAMVIKLSEWGITDTIDILVNNAIYDTIDELDAQYEDIVSINSDSNGKITSISTNMAYVNKLQTKIINKIYETIPDAESEVIEIPVTNILGSKIFSGIGPYIPVKILSVTNVNSELVNEFSDAGINQTLHRIFMRVDIELSVLIPGYNGLANVNTVVLIAETVIVGDVPDTYINFN